METTSLPTGTVTFLFTDIEGSTQLWERHPDAMRLALARHDALLRQAIETRGGQIFAAFGDGFGAAFVTAPAALAAAVAALHAVEAEAWGEVGAFRVRMGLHTGAAQQRDGDYFGPALNRVNRLRGAAHGGQILLSDTTEALVRDHLPEGASLRDLGEHRLKDLLQPVRVFQLVSPGLPSEFPPLETLDRLETIRQLRMMGQEILSQLDRSAIVAQLTRELPLVFPAKGATLFLLDPVAGVYRQTGDEQKGIALSRTENALLLRLREEGRPVRSAEYRPAPPAAAPAEWEMAQRLGAALWLPLMVQGRLIGTLALGAKASGEAYTDEEVEALGRLAQEAALALEIASLSAERERQARLQQELAIARSIQTGLLPPARLLLEGYELLSRSEPSTEVGGDFCDLFEVSAGPETLGILVGDVAGKGVPAALFMAMTTTLIRGQAQLLPSPAATLAAANAALYPKMRQQTGKQRRFATALYGILDTDRGEVRLANAGQPPPIYWPATGMPCYVRLKGTPLGALAAARYDEDLVHLAPGDRLLFYSDGFIEALSAAGEPLGYVGFLQRLTALGWRSGPELIDALFDAGSSAEGDTLHGDDRTLVLLTALASP
jgi:serine phosphatase RsbU (regulator of sigma subunit)/class 3 adenylate cyclase